MEHDHTSLEMMEQEYGPPSQDMTKSTFLQRIEMCYERLGCWAITTMLLSTPFIFLYLFFVPPMWIFNVVCIIWTLYDRETPHKGGRRMKWLRKIRFWRARRNYFPLKLVKTADLPPDTSYLFCCFPHVLHSISTNLMSDANHFDEAFPGLNPYIMTLNGNYYFPIHRDFLLFLGGCAASPSSILHILNGPPGNVAVLIVGGRREQKINTPGTNRIILKNRRGFIRMAMKTGSPLVPVYSFGETYAYKEPTNSFYKWLRQKIRARFDPDYFLYRGPLKLFYLFGILPYQLPVTTVVGKPIPVPKVENPPSELVDEYHGIFVQELQNLFNTYKVKYDPQGENATLSVE